MEIKELAEEWQKKGRLSILDAWPAREGPAPVETAVEAYVMTHHVLRLSAEGRTYDLPAEWFVPAYEGAAAFWYLLEQGAAGVSVDLSDGTFTARWELRRYGASDLGEFSLVYPDFQRGTWTVSISRFIEEGKQALQAFLSDQVIVEEGRCYFRAFEEGSLTSGDAWSMAAAIAVWNDLRQGSWLFGAPCRPLYAEECMPPELARLMERKTKGAPDMGFHEENPLVSTEKEAEALLTAHRMEEIPQAEAEGAVDGLTLSLAIGAEETETCLTWRTLSGREISWTPDPERGELAALIAWAQAVSAGRNVRLVLDGENPSLWQFSSAGTEGIFTARAGGADFSAAVSRKALVNVFREELRRFFSDENLFREGVKTVQNDAGRILYGMLPEEGREEARRHLQAVLASWNRCRSEDFLFPVSLVKVGAHDFLNRAALAATGLAEGGR